MASTIQIKNSTTSGNSPSSLATGELAINVVDGNFFYGSASAVKQDFALGNLTASNTSISGTLSIEGSGSTLFEVVGSEGQLFSITDNLSGSLFAVSDVSGLPILEVFSDDTVKIGTFNNEGLIIGGTNVTASGNVDIQGILSIPGFTNVSASLAAAVAGGDDLGNHTASLDLDMGGNAITNVGNVDGVDISALNSTVSTNTSNIATLTAATSSYLTTVDISDDTNLTAGTGITLTGDTLSTNDSQIVHDNLSGFVANEHIDHSTVSITAGNGLTGGGTIASTRTLNVGAGDGISVAADSVAVDSTVLRTTGDSVLSSSAQIASDISGAFTAGGGISLSGGEFSVAAGTGLTQGATGLSFDADGGTLTTNNADVDHILINDGGTFKRITKGNINVGDFNNNVGYLTSSPFTAAGISGSFTSVSASLAADIPTNNNQLTNGAGYTTNTGTVTSVGGTGTVSGLSLSGTVTTSGNLTLGGTISISSTNITDVDAFSQTGTYASLRAQGTTAGDVGLGNVTNESKATMFTSPTFTGTVAIPGFSDVSASLAAAVAGGDNLGNHTASLDLDMGGNAITNVSNVDGRDVSADGSKLDGIEAGADVTDTANVTAAGALMDSEVDADIKTLSLPANTTISTFGASLIDDTTATAARSTLGLGSMATQTSTDYVSINGDTLQGDLDLGTYNITNIGELRATTVSGSTFVSDGVTVVSTPDAQTVKIGQSAGGSGPMRVSIVSSNTQYGLFSNSGIELTGSVDISSTLSIPGFADVSASLAAAGTVDTTGTPANNQLAIFTDSNTIEGDSNLTWTGTTLNVGSNGDIAKFTALSSIIFNGSNDDAYFQVKGSSDDNLLQVNPQLNDRVGIGTSTPSQKLTVAGNISASGDLSIQGFTSVSASLAAAVAGGDNLGNHTATQDLNLSSNDITNVGIIKIGNGSVSAPSLAFTNDTNTGIYAVAPDTMGLVTGGSSKINVGSTVGVLTPLTVTDNTDNTNTTLVTINNTNTSSPITTNQYSLKVNGGAAYGTPGGQNKSYGGYFTAGNTNATNPDSIALYAQGHEDGAPNSYAAIFSGSAGGVVGINTVEPTVELDVVGDISASGNLSIGGIPNVSASIAAASGGGSSAAKFQVNGGAFLSQTAQRALPFGSSTGESTIFSYTTTYMIPADCKLVRVHTCSQASAGTVTLKAYTIPDATADNTAISNGTLLQTVAVSNHNAGAPFEFTFGSTGTISKGSKFGLTVESTINPNGFRFTAYFEEV